MYSLEIIQGFNTRNKHKKYTLCKGKRQIKAEVETFNFDKPVDSADLIAEVIIGKQIKEIDKPAPKYYLRQSQNGVAL